mmetsp:Transcript_87806/g.244487  ORF Transcript_87806/g.244487 Transcript_87806/m.244487 type:complete len:225 (+) Transcript_87806:301-975(+)
MAPPKPEHEAVTKRPPSLSPRGVDHELTLGWPAMPTLCMLSSSEATRSASFSWGRTRGACAAVAGRPGTAAGDAAAGECGSGAPLSPPSVASPLCMEATATMMSLSPCCSASARARDMATTLASVSATLQRNSAMARPESKPRNSWKKTAPVVSCATIPKLRYIGTTDTASPTRNAKFKQCSSKGAFVNATMTKAQVCQWSQGGDRAVDAPATTSATLLKNNAV